MKKLIALIALLPLAACDAAKPNWKVNEEHRRACIDSGKVAIMADPTDLDTDMIACVSVEQYQTMLNDEAVVEANIEPVRIVND